MTDLRPPDQTFLRDLGAILSDGGLRAPEDAPACFEDPRGRFTGRARAVAMPTSTAQVSAIVRLCAAARVGIVPHGGGTGVVAGQLATESDDRLVLSLARMNRIRAILPDDGVMIAEAGCILQDVHAAAAAHGLTFPLNMASRGSCRIGGNLATNAGGIQVVRHGNARDLCLGIEAVLPDGSVLQDLSPLRKNNTGYDLRHLLIGSEGTLGIITAATLVLKPQEPETATALCALASPGDALGLYRHLRARMGEALSALELMSGFGIDLVCNSFPALGRPFGAVHDWVLLVEVDGPAGTGDRLETALAETLDTTLVRDAVVAKSQAQREALWDLREYTPEANRLAGAICSSDTSVPVSAVNDFIRATHEALAGLDPALRVNTYGHIGDGNIHHNVLPPEGASKAEFLAGNPDMPEAVRMAINEATHRYGGSISAEHGIGRLKLTDLEHFAGEARLAALRRIKEAFDPLGIMNPGALLRPR